MQEQGDATEHGEAEIMDSSSDALPVAWNREADRERNWPLRCALAKVDVVVLSGGVVVGLPGW